MLERLPDSLLDSCRCEPQAPFAGDPARDCGLTEGASDSQLQAMRAYLDEQQQLLWANRRQALLIWLQGPDCAGKDGAIRHVLRGLNPQGVAVSNFRQPSLAERQEDFLARYRRRLPEPGQIGVFNRSPYEGVVLDRRDGFIDARAIPLRLQQIAAFEDELQERGIHLLKVYLQISPAEQKARLRRRLLDPRKHWKLDPADLQAHRQFATLQQDWAAVLAASHRPQAPWYVLPADRKWLRNLLLASLLCRQFEALALHWPQPTLPFSLDDLERS